MRSGRARRTSCRGSATGTACSSGTRRRSAGSSADRPTSATTPSIVTSLDGHGGRAALIYFNERGERVVQTYAQLLHEVKRIAAALRGLGIGKGDRITIYMPPCPESIALMLATVRIGAIHSVVFAGFGAQALGDRIAASGSRVVFASRRHLSQGARTSPLLPIVDGGAAGGRRVGRARRRARCAARSATLHAGATSAWDDFLRGGDGQDSGHEVDGSRTSRPSSWRPPGRRRSRSWRSTRTAAIRSTSSRMGKWCFGLRPTDVWWATSDIGWIVGHSYMVYAPLLTGCTTHRVRGRARLSAGRRQLARGGRGVRRDRHLHVADRRPHADALRRRAAARDRSLAASSASSVPAKC